MQNKKTQQKIKKSSGFEKKRIQSHLEQLDHEEERRSPYQSGLD